MSCKKNKNFPYKKNVTFLKHLSNDVSLFIKLLCYKQHNQRGQYYKPSAVSLPPNMTIIPAYSCSNRNPSLGLIYPKDLNFLTEKYEAFPDIRIYQSLIKMYNLVVFKQISLRCRQCDQSHSNISLQVLLNASNILFKLTIWHVKFTQ